MKDEFREIIKDEFSEIGFCDEEKSRMAEKLDEAARFSQERKGSKMKMKKWQKVAVAALAIVAVGGTVGAAGKQAFVQSWSNSFYDYKTVEDLSEASTEYGLPGFPAEFDNGYKFSGGNLVNNKGEDEAGNTTGSWKEFEAEYKNEADKSIWLSLAKSENTHVDDRDATDTKVIHNINITPPEDGKVNAEVKISYNEDEYLFLPPSSEGNVDPEIMEREENDDHFSVSFGSDKPETKIFKSASLYDNGVYYLLFSYDDVSEDELMSMAEELVKE